jgi:hypothetical protein
LRKEASVMDENAGLLLMVMSVFIFPALSLGFVMNQESQKERNIAIGGVCMGLAFALFAAWIMSL